jgi:lantibiotic modifying enzyme
MCKIQRIEIEQALAYLTINGSYLNDLGLFHGKMGIVLFFSELAHVSQNSAYEDLASNLLGKSMRKFITTYPLIKKMDCAVLVGELNI